jgi:methyl-accepting chemotaxis protein
MIRAPRHHTMTFEQRQKRRYKLMVVQKIQYKYAFFLLRFGLVFGFILAGVCLYLLNSNYFMFKNALLVHAPQVVSQLNSELKLGNEMIIATFLSYIVFMTLLGLRLSHRIVVPVILMQEKLKNLSRGDLKNAVLKIRKTDEFQEFCESYNYYVETARQQLLTDIEKLEALKPDSKNRDAVLIWEKMLKEKKEQAGINESSASLDPAPASHLAS